MAIAQFGGEIFVQQNLSTPNLAVSQLKAKWPGARPVIDCAFGLQLKVGATVRADFG
jgi:hypothetical protein